MTKSRHFKALEDYVAALKKVKDKYESDAKELEITDANVNTSFVNAKNISEKLFVLDYMLEVNGKLLDYLKCYQQTSPVFFPDLSPQALDAILKKVSENVDINDSLDIHDVIQAIERAVFQYAPAVEKQLKADASFRRKFFMFLSAIVIAMCVAILFAMPSNPIICLMMLPMPFVMAPFLVEVHWYGRQPGRVSIKSDTIHPALVVPSLSEEERGSLFERKMTYTGAVTKTYDLKDGDKIERTSGCNFFIAQSKKRSELRSEGMSEELRQAVKEEYNTLAVRVLYP